MARHRIGITLIELLVVMAIVALLLALVFPAIRSSRQAALRTECSNNMRQIAIGKRSIANSKDLDDSEREQEMLRETRVRICPVDKNGRERFEASGSSYVHNYPTCDVRQPMATSKTIILFEVADNVSAVTVDPCEWFAATNSTASGVMSAIQAAIELERHGGASNYAYADGHVRTIPKEAVYTWADRRFNFGLRNQGEYND
jgi:prepilin-type processing-associated H-X9-DG protein/prepilin-type N-terminal cleavage/methylation domain-containing protein